MLYEVITQPAALTLLKPNGGETIESASDYNIWWGAPPVAVSFTLRYSVDNGVRITSYNVCYTKLLRSI